MKVLTLVVVLLVAYQVYCDLPVHCLKHQIVGHWKVMLDKVDRTGFGPVPCGHDVPDRAETSYKAFIQDFKSERQLKLLLDKRNRVFSVNNEKHAIGHWTMVYDEGFEITAGDYKYFAFSKYGPQENGNDYVSYCGQTLIGWYHNTRTHERGCYRAVKLNEQGKATEQAHNGHVVQPKLLEIDDADPEEILTLEFQESIVNELNQHPKSWTAKVNPNWEGLTFSQINHRAGNRKHHKFQTLIEESESTDAESDPYRNFSLSDVSDFPKEFNWNDKLGPVREQKDCGSCYTVSTMGMLSARLRIQGHDVDLSVQQSIDCNYYNQGCDGGYPFLVEKFATEQYLVPESVYPYTGYTGKCQQTQKLKSQDVFYGAKNYRFVGGQYGKCSERKIMEEIYKNGPVVMNFEPEFDFMFYAGGIYHSVPAAEWIMKKQKKPEWEKVDHSVLCSGWGEEDGQKYWICQNSWGTQWGENGFFRMRRGTDESAIESMAEAADPVIYRRKNESFLQGQVKS